MARTPEQQLVDVAAATFESLAFLVQVAEDESGEGDLAPVCAATLNFSGPFRGVLKLTVCERVITELAGNMLAAEDEPVSDEQRTDALKELLNVICGHLLPILAGSKSVFHVDAPKLVDAYDIPEVLGGMPLWARTDLLLDAGRAELALYIEENARLSVGSVA